MLHMQTGLKNTSEKLYNFYSTLENFACINLIIANISRFFPFLSNGFVKDYLQVINQK